MEVRKKWQHCRSTVSFSGIGSRRLASTATMYAAVPANDAVHHPAGSQRAHQTTQQHSVAPAPSTRRTRLQTPNRTAEGDVIDDTVTSWIPHDARHGCYGYGDVSEGDDDSHQQQQQQQQHGRDAVPMTRLNYDRY